MNNTLFVLLDGAEDDPIDMFGGKKPLDVAETPYMDSVAVNRYRTMGRGYTHLFLNEFFTGYPPDTARAALEAMGLGLDMKDSSRTAYRLSPAEICDGMIHWSYHGTSYRDRLVGSVEKNLKLLDDLDPQIKFFIGGRAILTMRSDEVPDLPAPPNDTGYVKVPGRLGEFVEAVMDDMGGITDYPWGCGKLGHLHPGFKGLENMTAISNSPTALGISASLGHDIRFVEELDERFPIAAECLEKGNVFLHIDEVDEYSHQKDPMKKKKVLEHTDRMMEKYFPDAENIVFFADHGTSCVSGCHIITDVPVWTDIDLGPDGNGIIDTDRVVPLILANRK